MKLWVCVAITWHLAVVGSTMEAKSAPLQLAKESEHTEFVPPPAVVPQTHDPPPYGADIWSYPLHIEYSSDGNSQVTEGSGTGSHTHSVPSEQIGL